jgi:hypothetical protein
MGGIDSIPGFDVIPPLQLKEDGPAGDVGRMEGEKIVKTNLSPRRLAKLFLACALIAALIAGHAAAIPWTNYVGMLITAITGIVGLVIAWVVLAIVEVFNTFLVANLFCALILNPSFYGGGYTSIHAGTCGIPAGLPPANGLINMIRLVLGILYPVFAIIVVLLGAYLIFMASSPPHRARAKQMLMKVFIGMMIAALSPIVYQALLMVSGALTDGVLSIINDPASGILPGGGSLLWRMEKAFNSVMPFPGTGGKSITDEILRAMDIPRVLSAIVILAITATLWMLAIVVVLFRYTAVVFMGIMFPLTIALYMFEITRNMGRRMLKMTFVFIFTPAIMAFWLATALAIIPYARSSDNFFTGLLLLTVMSAMVSISPLQLSGILNVIGGIVTAVGQLTPGIAGTALVAVGGVMQGKGSSAIASAALKYSGGKLLKGGAGIAKSVMGAALGGGFKAGVATAANILKKPFSAAASAVKGAAGAASKGAAGTAKKGGILGRIGGLVTGGLVGNRNYGRAIGAVAGAVAGAAKATGRGAWAGAKATGRTLRGLSPRSIGGRWASLGRDTKALAKKVAGSKLVRMAAKVAVAKGVEKASGGTIKPKDMFKGTQGSGASFGKAWDKIKSGVKGGYGKASSALGALKLGVAAAYGGAKIALRTGFKGMGMSLRNANWKGIGKTALKGLGIAAVAGLGVAGGAALAGLGGVAAAGLGLSLMSKGVRTMAKEGVKRGIQAAWNAVKPAGRSLAAAYKSVRDKGVGRSIGIGFKKAGEAAVKKMLGGEGSFEYDRYKGKTDGRGGLARAGALADGLGRRVLEKAVGLSDAEIKTLGERGGALADKRRLEKSKGRTERMIENAGSKDPKAEKKFEKDWKKMSYEDKKELAGKAGVDVMRNPNWEEDTKKQLHGMDDIHRNQISKDMGDRYGSQIDDLEKKTETGDYAPRVNDNKLAKQKLQDDPVAGIDQNTVEDLSKMGIQTRGELAGKSDPELERLAKTTSTEKGYHREYTADELKSLRDGAEESIKRPMTRGERYRYDRGAKLEDIEKTSDKTGREKESVLKELISEGGGKQPMREDFLTAVEEERE